MSTEEVKTLTKNYHQLQHDVNGLRQTANLNSSDLREIKYALLGNPEFNYVGLVQQIKNHEEKHVLLEKRVTDIEQVNKVEEKIDTYKKNFFRLVWGSIGASVILAIKQILVYIFHL